MGLKIGLVIFLLLATIFVGWYASKLKRNVFVYVFLSLIISPFFVFIYLQMVGEPEKHKDNQELSNK
jgi:hypothetical protein